MTSQDKSHRKYRVAVVGGGIGQKHLDAFARLPNEFEITAFCDIDEERCASIASEYNIPRTYTDFTDLCADKDVEIISICTPPFLHFEQSLHAIESGKHVICEKPLASALSQIDALAAAEKKSGKSVMPVYQYRFGDGVQKLKFLMNRGVLGKPYIASIETTWLRGPDYYDVPWRGKWDKEYGGCLAIHAIHNHDILTYLFGGVDTVFAQLATRVNNIETEDCAAVTFKMQNGMLATSTATLGCVKESARLRFCFEHATVENHGLPYTPQYEPWEIVPRDEDAQNRIAQALNDFTPPIESVWFQNQFAFMHQALSKGEALPVTLDDARQSLGLLAAMYHSSRTNQPVQLPLDQNHPCYDGWLPHESAGDKAA